MSIFLNFYLTDNVLFSGWQYFDECPVETRIPIMLIVKGAFYILLGFLRFSQLICRCRRTSKEVQITNPADMKEEVDYGHYNSGAMNLETVGGTRNARPSFSVEPHVQVQRDLEEEEELELHMEQPIKMNILTLVECIIFIFLCVWFVAGK